MLLAGGSVRPERSQPPAGIVPSALPVARYSGREGLGSHPAPRKSRCQAEGMIVGRICPGEPWAGGRLVLFCLFNRCRWVRQQSELAKQAENPDLGPKLDLGFKEGQTIKLNIAVRGFSGSVPSQPLPWVAEEEAAASPRNPRVGGSPVQSPR